jgi:hypothetical protein
MSGDVWLARGGQVARPELANHVHDAARATEYHLDAGCGERFMSVWAAIAGEQDLHAPRGQKLSRLDACTLAKCSVGVLDSLELHRVCVDNQEVRTSTKPRIDFRLQRRAG